VFLVGALPVWLLAYASLQVSPEVMISFVVQAMCQYSVAGAAIGTVAAYPAERSAAEDTGRHPDFSELTASQRGRRGRACR